MFIAVGVILTFVVFPNQIISLSYTAKYARAKELLLPLGVATILMAISSMTGQYMLSIRKYGVFILSMFTVLIERLGISTTHCIHLSFSGSFCAIDPEQWNNGTMEYWQ